MSIPQHLKLTNFNWGGLRPSIFIGFNIYQQKMFYNGSQKEREAKVKWKIYIVEQDLKEYWKDTKWKN